MKAARKPDQRLYASYVGSAQAAQPRQFSGRRPRAGAGDVRGGLYRLPKANEQLS